MSVCGLEKFVWKNCSGPVLTREMFVTNVSSVRKSHAHSLPDVQVMGLFILPLSLWQSSSKKTKFALMVPTELCVILSRSVCTSVEWVQSCPVGIRCMAGSKMSFLNSVSQPLRKVEQFYARQKKTTFLGTTGNYEKLKISDSS